MGETPKGLEAAPNGNLSVAVSRVLAPFLFRQVMELSNHCQWKVVPGSTTNKLHSEVDISVIFHIFLGDLILFGMETDDFDLQIARFQ